MFAHGAGEDESLSFDRVSGKAGKEYETPMESDVSVTESIELESRRPRFLSTR